MAWNVSDPSSFIAGINQSKALAMQCDNYCIQQIVDGKYGDMVDIYSRFNGFLLALIGFFIVYALIEKAISSQEKGFWTINYIIGKKHIPFNPKPETMKNIKWLKGLLFGVFFALCLVYYTVYGHLLKLGY